MVRTSEETKNFVKELDEKFKRSAAFDEKIENALKLYTAITERLDAVCIEHGVSRGALGLEITGWAALQITHIPDEKVPGLSRLAFDNETETALKKHFGVCTVTIIPSAVFDEVAFEVVRHTPGYLLLTEIVTNIQKQTDSTVTVIISKEGESIINTMEEWESRVYGMPKGRTFINGLDYLMPSELPCIHNPDTLRPVFWRTELSEEIGFLYKIHELKTDPDDPGHKKFADAIERYLNDPGHKTFEDAVEKYLDKNGEQKMENQRKPFPFVCSRECGELVVFCPGDRKDGEFPGIIEGVTMLGGKVSFHIILTTGACVTTYGERVHDLETVLSKEDTDFLSEALYGRC